MLRNESAKAGSGRHVGHTSRRQPEGENGGLYGNAVRNTHANLSRWQGSLKAVRPSDVALICGQGRQQ
jgi:hypothetical protein